jgi:hypothetical protein
MNPLSWRKYKIEEGQQLRLPEKAEDNAIFHLYLLNIDNYTDGHQEVFHLLRKFGMELKTYNYLQERFHYWTSNKSAFA